MSPFPEPSAVPVALRLIAAAALTVAVGAAALWPRWWRRRPAPDEALFELAVTWTAGLAVIIPLLLFAGLAGWRLTAAGMTAVAAGTALALSLARRWGSREAMEAPLLPAVARDGHGRVLLWASRGMLAAAAGLVLWRIAAMPLWSWDHYAIWGVKAQRMLPGGHLDLAFLHLPELAGARPDYPLGLPMAWRWLALGALPDAATYKLLHGAFAVALLAVLRRGLAHLAGSPALGNALAAAALAGPLYWDTLFVGIAELPLALVAVTAAVLVAGGGGAAAWGAGLALGFLPWIKQEGYPLAILLAGFALLEARGRRRRALLAPAAAGMALSAIFAARELGVATTFLSGDPLARLGERLPRAWATLRPMAEHLLATDTLGFWPLLLAAALWAAATGRRRALGLAGVVAIQTWIYIAVTFVVYLPVADHTAAAFPRITAALMPLGLLAMAAAVAPADGARPEAAAPVG